MVFKRLMKEKWDIICIIIISIVSFLIMFNYAGIKSMWSDELCQISFIQKDYGIIDTIKIYAKLIDVSPPLFAVFAFFWYRIVPSTDKWLYVLPIIAATAGTYIIALSGRKAYNKNVGVLCALLAAVSPVTYSNIGLEFRQYAFLYLVSAIVFYCFILRNKEGKECSWKRIIVYGVSLCLLPYTHYISVLICIGFFLSDLILIAKKKIAWKCLFSYLIGALLFLPWGIIVLLYKQRNVTEFWPQPPKFTSILNTLRFLTGKNEQLYLVLLFSLAVIFGMLILHILESRKNSKKYFYVINSLWICVFMISAVYFYSKVFMPNGSMYVERYFISLLPFIYLVVAWVISYLCSFLYSIFKNERKYNYVYIIVSFMLIFIIGFGSLEQIDKYANKLSEPYRETAAMLGEAEDIYDEDVAVISSDPSFLTEGWIEHYVSHVMDNRTFQVLSADQGEIMEEIENQKYRRIYVIELHQQSNKNVLKQLRKNYDMKSKDNNYKITIYDKKEQEK